MLHAAEHQAELLDVCAAVDGDTAAAMRQLGERSTSTKFRPAQS
ncbi:MAG TPA: hypothetical protein VJR25_14775 [Microbacterium sp.]|nr:hypothetical protein [Microbacterium sp.]HKT58024.1 hypothetical protein [Microbacterium sp.]